MPRGSADLVAAATDAGECVFVPGIGGAAGAHDRVLRPRGRPGHPGDLDGVRRRAGARAHAGGALPERGGPALPAGAGRADPADRRPRRQAVVGRSPGRRADEWVQPARAGGCPTACPSGRCGCCPRPRSSAWAPSSGCTIPSPALTSATDERRRVLLTLAAGRPPTGPSRPPPRSGRSASPGCGPGARTPDGATGTSGASAEARRGRPRGSGRRSSPRRSARPRGPGRPARTRAARSGSLTASLSAAARSATNASGSTGVPLPSSTCSIGTSQPVSPSTTTSGMPPVAVATTASSQAIASRLTMPSGS